MGQAVFIAVAFHRITLACTLHVVHLCLELYQYDIVDILTSLVSAA